MEYVLLVTCENGEKWVCNTEADVLQLLSDLPPFRFVDGITVKAVTVYKK